MSRNLSLGRHFCTLAERHSPRFRFAGKDENDWRSWREQLAAPARASLGTMPPKVPLNPEIQAEWTEAGLQKQRVIFDVEDGLSAVAYVFRPSDAKGKLPGILACHGHGPFGKEAVMGNRSSLELRENIELHNYDYGLQMA